MSDEKPKVPTIGGSDLATALAQEIAKQLPVKDIYQDGVASPLKETSSLLTDVVKTIRLALAPIQLTAALQDHFRPFIEKAFSRVKEEDRIAPAPQIMGPVLEGKKFEPDETPIDQMFSELLSRACDRTRTSEAHPSYPALIRSLSADEARILLLLHERQDAGAFARSTEYKITRMIKAWDWEDMDFLAKLDFSQNFDFYIQRLVHLHLVEDDFMGIRERIGEELDMHYRSRKALRLTRAGKAFLGAVSTKPTEACT